MLWAFRVRKTTHHGFSPDGKNFWSTANGVLTAHIEWLTGVDQATPYHLCSTYTGLWVLVVVQLSWLGGRVLVAQVVWLPASSLSSATHLITSIFLSMRHDALSSQHFRSLVHLWKAKETNCQLCTGTYLPSGICHTAQQAVPSYWGTTSCTTYPLHKTSVTLIPQEEIKEQVINIHVMLTTFTWQSHARGLVLLRPT